MSVKISLDELIQRGAHFGHQARRWNPKMQKYIYGEQDGVHIFDLTKTQEELKKTLDFLSKSRKEGKVILFVGSKKQAQDKVKEVAEELGLPYVTQRWLGGTLTNFGQIKKSIDKLSEMKKAKSLGEYKVYTKKEQLLLDREIDRLEKFFGGMQGLTKKPDIIFVTDVKKDISAVREARKTDVEIVGIVDTNADPDMVDYIIPMNDDATKALEYVLNLIKEALIKSPKAESIKPKAAEKTSK